MRVPPPPGRRLGARTPTGDRPAQPGPARPGRRLGPGSAGEGQCLHAGCRHEAAHQAGILRSFEFPAGGIPVIAFVRALLAIELGDARPATRLLPEAKALAGLLRPLDRRGEGRVVTDKALLSSCALTVVVTSRKRLTITSSSSLMSICVQLGVNYRIFASRVSAVHNGWASRTNWVQVTELRNEPIKNWISADPSNNAFVLRDGCGKNTRPNGPVQKNASPPPFVPHTSTASCRRLTGRQSHTTHRSGNPKLDI
ncbi:DUF6420 family protein [Streptomyces sp. NPDC058613]|uniref:DUF6420 family protein n=1 Tax=Streptomyces sp. NPDC058613 TaxID=3346556 RepID=UPI0036624E72